MRRRGLSSWSSLADSLSDCRRSVSDPSRRRGFTHADVHFLGPVLGKESRHPPPDRVSRRRTLIRDLWLGLPISAPHLRRRLEIRASEVPHVPLLAKRFRRQPTSRISVLCVNFVNTERAMFASSLVEMVAVCARTRLPLPIPGVANFRGRLVSRPFVFGEARSTTPTINARTNVAATPCVLARSRSG